jgi:hypothetical protein
MCLSETHSKVYVFKRLPDAFPVWNGWNKGNMLPPLLSNFYLECAIKKVHES